MGLAEDKKTTVLRFLRKKKIANLEEIKAILGTDVRMTAFCILQQLEYLSSYSHRGQFYTLFQIPKFDENGLCSLRSVCFSRHGNLISTAKAFVEESEDGYTANELENVCNSSINRGEPIGGEALCIEERSPD